MRIHPLVAGLIAVLFSGVLVMGGLSLSLAETPPSPTSTQEVQAPPEAPTQAVLALQATATRTATRPQPTPTVTLTPTACPVPAGWQAYTTLPGDTYELLASVLKTRADELRQANCVDTGEPLTGARIYLPPQPASSPSATNTLLPCAQPPGWVAYTVKPGDYLAEIASRVHITVDDLRRVNCLGASSIIQPGQSLYVPEMPGATPTALVSPTQPGTN